MKNILISVFLAIMCQSYSQLGDFQILLDMYDGEENRIDSVSARKFFDFTSNDYYDLAYTGEIVFQRPYCVGLTCYLPCEAGGICESSILRVFDYNGNIIYDFGGFESHFADCEFSDERYCSFISDSLLIITYESEKRDCTTDSTYFLEAKIFYHYITNSCAIELRKSQQIDTRRDYYYTSCQVLTEYILRDKTKDELAIMRNEIFASHGYKFKTEKWSKYFSGKYWYIPKYDEVNSMLNPIEKVNVNLILDREKN